MSDNRIIRSGHISRIASLLLVRVIVFFCFLGVFSVVLILCYDILTQHNYFSIKTFLITGNSFLSEQDLLKQAGLEKGMNTFKLSLTSAKKRLSENPWIRWAKIKRELPDKLIISIKERQAVALIEIEKKKFLMDEDGYLFKIWEKTDPNNIPLISGLESYDFPVDDSKGSVFFKAIMQILNPIVKTTIMTTNDIKEIKMDHLMGMTIISKEGTEIRFGHGEYSEKYMRLERILNYIRSKEAFAGIRFIDINDMNRIVVRPNEEIGQRKGAKYSS